jgi:predicted ABC-type ATPase
MSSKELIVVAGPNGAGKSTFVARFLKERSCPYHCADSIATEFSQLDPVSQQVAAGREFMRRIEDQLSRDEDFVIETTLSGRTLRNYLAAARSAGFGVVIYFVYLDSPDTCVARVRQRVRRGGHNVPVADIRRRFSRSLANFWQLYREIADYWYIVYNSSGELKWIASGEPDAVLVHEEPEFRQYLRLAGVSDVETGDQP